MKLSKESECALNGLVVLAAFPAGEVHSVAEIAERAEVTRPFLAKMFQRLARAGLLQAKRGRAQGYMLARPAAEINVREVLEAIEGAHLFRHCTFWGNTCSEENPCVLHAVLRDLAVQERDLLGQTSVAALIPE